MTKAEILSEIKRAEDDTKTMVAKANEAKNREISEAKMRSKEIIRKTEEEALQSAESEINKAREQIQKEKEKIIEKGFLDASVIKRNAQKNTSKATKFILTEFERAADA